MENYYEILGVNKEAPQEEIKKAFRKLALENHPDKFQEEKEKKEAEERFKKINEAYQCLSDDNKRKQYDMFGTADNNAQNFSPFGGFGNFENIVSEFFGQYNFGKKQHYQYQPKIQPIPLSITFKECIQGTTKQISFNLYEKCNSCKGTGEDKQKSVEECPSCKGKGFIEQKVGDWSVKNSCLACNATGKITFKCNAKGCQRGFVPKQKTIQVKIPAGIKEGNTMQLTVDGQKIFVIISFVPQENVLFDDNGTIQQIIPLTYPEIMLGGNTNIETYFGEKISIKMPGLSENKETKPLRLAGMGLPINVGSPTPRADLLISVDFRPIFSSLSEEHRNLLEQLKELYKRENI